MPGRTRIWTREEVDDREELPTPNLVTGEVYWLSNKEGQRLFAPLPVRAHRVRDAAERAVRWIGGPVLIWSNDRDGGEIVWVQWPEVKRESTGRSMEQFSYVP